MIEYFDLVYSNCSQTYFKYRSLKQENAPYMKITYLCYHMLCNKEVIDMIDRMWFLM